MINHVDKVKIEGDVVRYLEQQEGDARHFNEIFEYIWENVPEVQKQTKHILTLNLLSTLNHLIEVKRVRSRVVKSQFGSGKKNIYTLII